MPSDLQKLQSAADALGLSLPCECAAQLIAYRDLIAKWNKVYNLTSLRDRGQMLTHHLVDSMAAISPLQQHLQTTGLSAARLLDVGSGGGLPGVVMAAAMPQIDVTCVDAVGKKAAFVQQVAHTLGIKNLRALHCRVEALSAPAFDVITSRAFASLADFVRLTCAHLKPGGAWMALKGKHPDDEIASLPAGVAVFHVERLRVPGLEGERCIVWMKQS